APTQRPQPTHTFVSMDAFLSAIVMAPWAQFFLQEPQPIQTSWFTKGLPALCISILPAREPPPMPMFFNAPPRSEEHTSELQSRFDLVCRLLLEKKNTQRQ